jgi:hypothetical protein
MGPKICCAKKIPKILKNISYKKQLEQSRRKTLKKQIIDSPKNSRRVFFTPEIWR